MTIFMAGDSIMKENDYYTFPQFGWGQALKLFLKDKNVIIKDYAENGRSTKSFIEEGRLDKIIDEMEKDDYLIVSFGHNDEKINDLSRYTDPFGEYQDNLLYFARLIEQKKGHIIFATPVIRHQFENNKCINSHGDYPKAMMDFANKYNYPCVDLFTKTFNLYNKLGEEKSSRYHLIFGSGLYSNYPDGRIDHSHLNIDGAVMVSKFFVEGLYELNNPLKEYFIDVNNKIIDNDYLEK